ncbi:MAG: hypothetical protein U9O06_01545 [Euryarchaeota archaeon]|nr:hypothetical protein [Euryarchaeota archaeon]
MSKYRVTCQDCSDKWEFDDDDPPDYANPAKNRHLPGDSVEDAQWDAHSAACGARDNHATDTGMTPPYESHDVEIVEVNE